MSWFHWLIGALATYRLTVLIARDACPWDVCKRLRSIDRFSKLLSCPFCVSVWMGALVALGYYFGGKIEMDVVFPFVVLSFSAMAILLDRTFTADFRA